MRIGPRREIQLLSPGIHGALDFAELRRLGLRPEDVLDFSANTNPYGPSPLVQAAVAGTPIERYPDRETLALRGALAKHLDLAPAEILAGNGATELIWLTALAFLHPGDRVLVLGPTYGEYARAAILMGASVTTWAADEENDFALDPEGIEDSLDRLQPRLVFICNPNNPTGATLPPEAIGLWARRHPRTLFVADEAYLAFAPGLGSVIPTREDNQVVVRSLTKDFGLAGLRLGYAVAREEVISWLKCVQPPWSVSAAAQAAGVAALQDSGHVHRSLALLVVAKEDLLEALANLGLISVPSATHFFLLRVGDGAAFRAALLKSGILVRDCASFGLPAYVRIASRRPEENDRLVEACQRHARRCPLPSQKVDA